MGEQCTAHEELCKFIEVLQRNDIKIFEILNGNGEAGTVEKARVSYDYMVRQLEAKNGWQTWIFRTVLAAMLGYVVYKVGG